MMKLAVRYFRVGILAFLIALVLTLAASAHEVGMRADIEVRSAGGGSITYSQQSLPSNAQISSITITVIYDTGEPMANGRIQIYAPGAPDTPWRVGRLDAEGRYRFSPNLSRRGRWTVRVQSEGHSSFMNLMI